MEQVIEIRVPDLGSSGAFPVIELLVQPGDPIEIDTPLITLESEKATMDVPSTVRGHVEAVLVSKGARVASGDLVVRARVAVQAAGGTSGTAAASGAPAPQSVSAAPSAAAPPAGMAAVVAAPASPPPPPSASALTSPSVDGGYVRAGPAVRRLARELGVELSAAKASGRGGRLTPEDVKAYAKAQLRGLAGRADSADVARHPLPAIPMVDFAAFGPVESHPLSRIQRISGPRLHASWVNLPHVTQLDEADITDLEAARVTLKPKTDAAGVKLTPLAFVLRACAAVLPRFPGFNASLTPDGQSLVYKQYIHIGFAADTPQGLVVPVLRDASRLDVFRIARQLAELSDKARRGKLQGADMQGGSFTISSLGGIGGGHFTPIINAPEVAILGVSRAVMKPVWQGGAFQPRLMLPLSLSYDHRVIDGADGARFITALREALADPRGLLEAVP